MLDRSKGRRQTKRDAKTDAGSSVISSDLKHRANDVRDGLSSYSNRRDQSGLNSCCTVIWKANGKTTTLSLFLDSLFPKTEIPYICEMLHLETKQSRGKLLPQLDLQQGVFQEEMFCRHYKRKEGKEQKGHHSCKIGTWNIRTLKHGGKLENLKMEMQKNKLSVLGVSEEQCTGQG